MRTGLDRVVVLVVAAAAIDSVGNGLFYAAGALYLSRSMHMPATELGRLLTMGAAVALIGVFLVGKASDRIPSRHVLVALKVSQSVAIAGLLVGPDILVFVVLTAVLALGDRGGDAARGALIAGLGEQRRIRTAAVVRSAKNAGIALGAAAGAVPLAMSGTVALGVAVGADGVTFLLGALLYGLVPASTRSSEVLGAAAGRHALSDTHFLRFVLLNLVLALEYPVLSLILPLWVARTAAPLWFASPLLLINTVMCVTLQVRASRGCETVSDATRLLRRAGLALSVAALLGAAATDVSAPLVIPAMLLFVVVHTSGEMWHAAAGWGLSFGLADPRRQGEYQGVHYLGVGASGVMAPAVLTLLCVSAGPTGWVVLAAMFAVAAVATPVLLRSAAERVDLRSQPT